MTNCEHKKTIVVSNQRYCCKCNKYMGKVKEIDSDFKQFVDKLSEVLKK